MKISRWVALSLVSVSVCGSAFADAKAKKSLDLLISKLGALGKPKIDGTDLVAGKKVPALFFGTTKINNNFQAVDEVKAALAGVATVFVAEGAEFVRISTNVISETGERGIGTQLAKNPAHVALSAGKEFCGAVDILGKPHDTCYTPIKDDGGKVLGAYFTGYRKR